MKLEDALELFHVITRGEWEFSDLDWDWPKSFGYGVVSGAGGGVIALFTTERAALQYRLFLVNERLNAEPSPELVEALQSLHDACEFWEQNDPVLVHARNVIAKAKGDCNA